MIVGCCRGVWACFWDVVGVFVLLGGISYIVEQSEGILERINEPPWARCLQGAVDARWVVLVVVVVVVVVVVCCFSRRCGSVCFDSFSCCYSYRRSFCSCSNFFSRFLFFINTFKS